RGHPDRPGPGLHGQPAPAPGSAERPDRRPLMRPWLRGKPGGFVTFLGIAALVAGGLGWVTTAALRLEQEQGEARTQAEYDGRLRGLQREREQKLQALRREREQQELQGRAE